MTFEEKITIDVYNMPDEVLVNTHNDFCADASNEKDFIYHMNEFDEVMAHFPPHEIACKICFSSFSPLDTWFKFNSDSDLESTLWIDDFIDRDVIADRIIKGGKQ